MVPSPLPSQPAPEGEDPTGRQRTVELRRADRLGPALVKLLLLTGLWGLVCYARWLLPISGPATPASFGGPPIPDGAPHQALLGKWEATDGSGATIRFTKDWRVLLDRDDLPEFSGVFDWHDAAEIEVCELRFGWRGETFGAASWSRFHISVKGDQLSITESNRHEAWDREDTRFTLQDLSTLHLCKPWEGKAVTFKRSR
jgi:hypothetical protein